MSQIKSFVIGQQNKQQTDSNNMPLDGLTDTEKLRVQIENRDYEDKLAASNATLFDKEAKMLQLDTARRANEQSRLKAEADQAYAQNVLTKAQTPEDLDRMSRDFIANNQQYASQLPSLLESGNKMFASSSTAKSSALQLAQLQRRDEFDRETMRLEMEAKNSGNTLSILQDKENERKIKLGQVKESNDRLDGIRKFVDPNDDNMVNFASFAISEINNAPSEQLKSELSNRYSSIMQVNDSFKSTQNIVANDTANLYGEEISSLKNDPKVQSAYRVWVADPQNAEEIKGVSEEGAFARYIGSLSLDSDNPNSIAFEISQKGAKYGSLLTRAASLKRARDSYNKFASSLKPREDGSVDYNRALILAEGLDNSSLELKSVIESQRKLAKDSLEQRKTILSNERTQASINNLRANTDQQESLRRSIEATSRTIASLRKTQAGISAKGDSKSKKAAEGLDSEIERLNAEMTALQEQYDQGKQGVSPENTDSIIPVR